MTHLDGYVGDAVLTPLPYLSDNICDKLFLSLYVINKVNLFLRDITQSAHALVANYNRLKRFTILSKAPRHRSSANI